MQWLEHYQMFKKLKSEIENAFKKKDKILFYFKDDNSRHQYYKTVEHIEEWVSHYFEQYKLQYIQNSKTIHNPFRLIDNELKDILTHFTDRKFNIIVKGHNVKRVNGEEIKTPTSILLYYSLSRFYEDLENGKIKGEYQESTTFYMLWAYVKYWFWLHEQHPAFSYLLFARSIGLYIEDQPDEETIIDLILIKNVRPHRAFQQISLFLGLIDDNSLLTSLKFYIRDKVYSLYQLEKIRSNVLNINHKNSSKEALQAFYYEFMELMKESFDVKEKEARVKISDAPKKPLLVWNGTKFILLNIFYIKNVFVENEDGDLVPLLAISNPKLVKFIKENFNIYNSTKESTIESALNARKIPTKSQNKIQVILGEKPKD